MIFIHKTIEISRKTWFSLYKRNVFTILITPECRRFSLVPSESINFMKKEEKQPRVILGGGALQWRGPWIFNFCSWYWQILNIFFIGPAYLFAYRQNIYYFVGFMYKSEICKLEWNKSNFSKNCEALNFCSWYLLILSIFFIGSAYSIAYRRNIYRCVGWMHKSIEKTLEICDFHIYVVFLSCEWAPPCFCSNKNNKKESFETPLGPPYVDYWGGEKAYKTQHI